MCQNQLGRRNLTDVQRTLLIGEAYRAQKMTQGAPKGNTNAAKQSLQNEDFELNGKTKNIIAEKFNVGGSTVERAGNFVESLDAANTISAGFKAPQYVIQEIRNIPESQLPAAVEAIKSGDIDTAKGIIQQSKPEPWYKSNPPPFKVLLLLYRQNLSFVL